MSTKYANILAARYHAHSDTSMQGDVELAFVVIENLSSTDIATEPWQKLLLLARGFIKTRARRSRARFKMQYVKALEHSDLLKPPTQDSLPEREPLTEISREAKFLARIRNPGLLRRSPPLAPKDITDIDPVNPDAIIMEETPSYKEREDEFTRRLRSPESFRRSAKATIQK